MKILIFFVLNPCPIESYIIIMGGVNAFNALLHSSSPWA